jgi:Leucine-rich repeat (LRR) protein
MQKLYFLAFLVLGLVAQAQIVNIPDANFKAKLLAASASNSTASTENPQYTLMYDPTIYVTWNVSSNAVIDTNGDGEIQVSEAQMIKCLDLFDSNISNLTGIEAFTNLKFLKCSHNNLVNINFSGLSNLIYLNVSNNPMTSINLANHPNLIDLRCNVDSSSYGPGLNSIDLTTVPFLKYLNLNGNNFSSLDLSNLINLEILHCYMNDLQNLDVSALINLKLLHCGTNDLQSLNVSNLVNLQVLRCFQNELQNLDISDLTSLRELNCNFNQLTILDVSQNTLLTNLSCSPNNLLNLDLSQNTLLTDLSCQYNSLTFLNLKNGNIESNLNFSGNPNLEYICLDDAQIVDVQSKIFQYGYTNCHLNTYCSFLPGGVFYEIFGQIKFDSNANGCDVNDINYPNLKFNITDGTNNGTFIADISGSYYMPVGAGIHTVTPVLENPSYYTISPSSFTIDFPTQASPFAQDFCVTANGVHSDVEIALLPTTPARPGFDASYKLIFKNNGNQIENGNVSFDFDDSVLDFVSSSIVFNSQSTSSNNTTGLVWNYTNLQPFETREIDIILNVNSPTETPAVNIDDLLGLFAQITTTNTDENLSDNTSDLRQVVVGSYDPNVKTCLEGETINPSMIGEYVHYMIRFENTGTYPAENIVVRDDIDPTQFDINTLIPLSGSHEFYTRINGNKVEFIFENINLDFDDATNDGYVAFKIKTLSTLTVNSTISNTAKIYFDYNYPIVTNTATSTYQVLNAQSFEFDSAFTLYPNPAKEVLHLQVKNSTTIQSIEIYNVVGQLVLALPNAGTSIDVSSLESGSYFIKINTDNGSTSTKFIKE